MSIWRKTKGRHDVYQKRDSAYLERDNDYFERDNSSGYG